MLDPMTKVSILSPLAMLQMHHHKPKKSWIRRISEIFHNFHMREAFAKIPAKFLRPAKKRCTVRNGSQVKECLCNDPDNAFYSISWTLNAAMQFGSVRSLLL
ncbi:hypothetical protein NECAME_07896 [Necator americanus]|uniref:Uncharacterized protein n=1 Tax=Necator americanus TaxID=51031 RepID=W2TKA4_NECAM|nr:hypothetical protein NECAME_07896 [Necator americanus]ETN82510.1 hypothetical protein NECAME_07896 [Necator americanus]